jgi:multifunctional beta-oxidation protein
VAFPNDRELLPEMIVARWKQITAFDERSTNPSSGPEALQQIMENFGNVSGDPKSGVSKKESYEDAEDTPEIKAAKQQVVEPDEFTYTERDVMLYNLGIGAKADELKWTYENADGFSVR